MRPSISFPAPCPVSNGGFSGFPTRAAIFCFGFLIFYNAAPEADARDDITLAIERVLSVEPESGTSANESLLAEQLRAIYGRRGNTPIWVSPDGSRTVRADVAVTVLENADGEGLDPRRYGFRPRVPVAPVSLAGAAMDDLAITARLLAFAKDLSSGQVSPVPPAPDFCGTKNLSTLRQQIVHAIESWSPEAVASLRPPHQGYMELQETLARYRRIVAQGGWGKLPSGPLLRPGARSAVVVLLRRRLETENEPPPPIGPEDFYDRALVHAVRNTQHRYGLEPDGIVGPKTRRALNVPAKERAKQIAVNMERWRWMPRELGETYLMVNVAGFRFAVMERDTPVITGSVIAGRPSRPTPLFNSRITRVVINPDWVVPPTILRKDVLPKVRKDPNYLSCAGFEVLSGWGRDAQRIDPKSVDWQSVQPSCVPFKFRQPPGPDNPLGRVKFLMPNSFDVYIHDTNSRDLFKRAKRAFSSGCVRVSEALAIADFLLKREGRESGFLERSLEGGETVNVDLNLVLPVYLAYFTTWVEKDGVVNFRDDIYGWDKALLKAIEMRPEVHFSAFLLE